MRRLGVVASLTDLRAAAATRSLTSRGPSSFPIPTASLPESSSEDSESESGFDSDESRDGNARKELFSRLNGTQQTPTTPQKTSNSTKPAKKRTTPTKRAASSDSESSIENISSGSDLESGDHLKKFANVAPSAGNEQDSKEDSNSEPSFDFTSGPDSDAEGERDARTDTGYNVIAIPARLRGTGFQAAPSLDRCSQGITDVLKKAKSAGQQVWYFTVPESIPVTAIEKMAIEIQAAREGRFILSHQDKDYTMSMDRKTASLEEMKLIVADKSSYSQGMVMSCTRVHTLEWLIPVSAITIDHVMHLERVHILAPPSVPVEQSTARKTPRQQPKGLKIRCHPIGIVYSNTSSIDRNGTDESVAEMEMAKVPKIKSSKSKNKSKKRKHAAMEQTFSTSRVRLT